MVNEIEELSRRLAALPPTERARFAAIVRAQSVLNNAHWRAELARRNRAVDAGNAIRVTNATEVLAARSGGAQAED